MILDGILFWLSAFFMALSLGALMWLAARVAVVRQRRRAARTARRPCGYCPTRRSVWWVDALLPWRLLVRHACGYDLSHQPPIDGSGLVRCPECGQTVAPRQRLVVASRSRPGRVAFASMILTSASFAAMLSRGDGWIRYAPTCSLLGLRETGVSLRRTAVREELFKRVRAGDASPQAQQRFLEQLAHDLRDDAVRGNAIEATEQIDRLGDAALPALHEAVRSPDRQQRQHAFVLLAQADRQRGAAPPDDHLIAVAIEALRDDRYEVHGGNAKTAVAYLARHARTSPKVEWEIVRALRTTDDHQQRVLCAMLCGYCGFSRGMVDAYPILVECLADNAISGDATAAGPAIAGFGSAVVPLLEATRRRSADAQQCTLIDALLFDLGAASAPAVRPDGWAAGWSFRWNTTAIDWQWVFEGGIYWIDEYAEAKRRAAAKPSAEP